MLPEGGKEHDNLQNNSLNCVWEVRGAAWSPFAPGVPSTFSALLSRYPPAPRFGPFTASLGVLSPSGFLLGLANGRHRYETVRWMRARWGVSSHAHLASLPWVCGCDFDSCRGAPPPPPQPTKLSATAFPSLSLQTWAEHGFLPLLVPGCFKVHLGSGPPALPTPLQPERPKWSRLCCQGPD